MSKKRYVLVVSEINPYWVKLCFEDGEFMTVPRSKLPENIYEGQLMEVSIKTTTFLTILKKIEDIAKKKKDIQNEASRISNK
ncbi:MAG: hypothetical protein ABDH21_04940 [bacterium]